MANRIVVDSCFWFAVFSPRDSYHSVALSFLKEYFDKPAYEILVPFPTMYEVLCTKFVKDKEALLGIKKVFNSNRVIKVYDENYRDKAIELTLSSVKRDLSLVDNIIRLMLEDKQISAKGLITFNIKDFVDVCQMNSIIILNM